MILSLVIALLNKQISILGFLQQLIFCFTAVLLAMTVHEFSHALASYLMGDKTAKYDGRLSFNPLNHLDPWGLLLLLVIGFGWAKPVSVNYNNLKSKRSGLAITAAAGPLSNFIFAFIALFFYGLSTMISNATVSQNLGLFLSYLATFNISLGLFNLIPIPPLDGSKIIGELLPQDIRYKYYSIERYSMIILILIIILLNRLNIFSAIQFGIANGMLKLLSPLFRLIAG